MSKLTSFISLVAILLFIFDRTTKFLAIAKLPLEGVFITNFFNLKLFYNPQLAFSLPLPKGLAIILTIIIIIFLIYYLIKITKMNRWGFFALSLIIIGAVSNLIDRWRFGHVVDFINFSFWPSFNLADVYIVIGAIILLIILKKSCYSLYSKKRSCRRRQAV